jgi:hypothetical protein
MFAQKFRRAASPSPFEPSAFDAGEPRKRRPEGQGMKQPIDHLVASIKAGMLDRCAIAPKSLVGAADERVDGRPTAKPRRLDWLAGADDRGAGVPGERGASR